MHSSTFVRILASIVAVLHATRAASSPHSAINVLRTRNSGPDHAGCIALAKEFNKKNLEYHIYFEGTDVYSYENSPREFWSNTEILSPLCVFRPTSAEQIGDAVKILRKANIKFAVRGGGHMGIKVIKHFHQTMRTSIP